MSLDSLPNELLIQITKELKHTRDISKVSLCSHRFHALSIPILYSESPDGTKIRSLLLFLRAVFRRPDYGRYTKCLFGCNSQSRGVGREELLDFFEQGEVQSLTDELDSLIPMGTRLRKQFYELCYPFTSEVITALLMFLLTNIEYVRISSWIKPFSDKPQQHLIQEILTWLDQEGPAAGRASKLMEMGVEDDGGHGQTIEGVLGYLNARSVKSFACSGLLPTNFSVPMRVARGPSGLIMNELALCNSDLDPASLRTFLRCFSRLRHFHYTFPEGIPFGRAHSRLILPALRSGLYQLKDSIESIEILSPDPAWDDNLDEGESPVTLGSFAKFEKLHTMHFNAFLMLGSEWSERTTLGDWQGVQYKFLYNQEQIQDFINSLPVSLEYLKLEDRSRAVLDLVMALLASGDVLKNLKHIHHVIETTFLQEAVDVEHPLGDWPDVMEMVSEM